MGNKFGWHSGVLTCKDAKIVGDLYVQDDIIFSDVSAGRLGVTGGLDFNQVQTTSAIAIHFIDAFLGKVIETGTYQSTSSGGVTLDSTNNRPAAFLFDDAGALLGAADYRPLVSRTLLTIDQSNAITLNSIRGQIKLLDGIDLSSVSSNMAPVQGYLELTGTGARTLAGHVAGVRSALEEGASGTTTISASSYYAGFEATLNSTRTYTETGKMAGFIVNISGGTSVWPKGIYIDTSATTTGIEIGTAVTGILLSGAMTDGLKITGICADGIEISGAATTTGLNVSGDCVTGITLGAQTTAGITIGATATALNLGACTTGLLITGAVAGAAIDLDAATFANTKYEIAMRNTVAGDKTIIAAGTATDDAGIVTAVGADADIADGSLYISSTDGAGALFIKKNDVWTAVTTA